MTTTSRFIDSHRDPEQVLRLVRTLRRETILVQQGLDAAIPSRTIEPAPAAGLG